MQQAIVQDEMARISAPPAINGLGIGFIGPTIIVHGTEAQKQRYLKKMLTAEEVWCLGDLVGYGAQPDECVQLCRDRCDLSLAGNHDLVVTGDIPISDFSASAIVASASALRM